MPRGGYQEPATPAPVSGPGPMSQRTDGGAQPIRDVPGGEWGDRQEMRQLQQDAPLAAAPGTTSPSSGGPAPALTPFDAPSASPDQPVTAGAPMGDGPGPEALGLPSTDTDTNADLEKLRPYLPTFIARANDPNSTQSFRNYVRMLRTALIGG